MKKFIPAFFIIFMIVGLLQSNGYAYTTISGAQASELFYSNEELVVVDVREDYEYCPKHISCAINYPYNSGIFHEKYDNLPTDAPILVVCASGNRSSRAASILNQNGYETVYSLSGGMSSWHSETYSCNDVEICEPTNLYFSHIASGDGWETEIAIINTSPDTPLNVTLMAYNASGELIDDSHSIKLPAAGRSELIIGDFFEKPSAIRYIIMAADNNTVYGYLKFYNSPGSSYRVGIPAQTSINQDDIIVSHITSTDGWWTGLALVNTNKESRTMTFTFNNGQSKNLTLGAGVHQSITMADFLADLTAADINSAIISNADGIIGLEIFGNGNQLSGVLLRDTTTQSLYYPHIASDQTWWTGIVAFNPGQIAGELVIKPYSEDGTLLSPATPATPIESSRLTSPATAATPIEIGARERFIGSASGLNLPEETAWLAIETTVPVSGFELFGTINGLQLAGYTSVGIDGYTGVFPKQETHGWSGIALVNTTADPITVVMKAYRNDGHQVGTSSDINLNGYQRVAAPPENLFNEDIDSATYIAYSATAPVVAFQLNSSGNMLDALPGRQ